MDKRKDKSFRVFLGLLPSRDSVTPTWLPLLSNQIGKTKLVGITRNTGFVTIDCVSVYYKNRRVGAAPAASPLRTLSQSVESVGAHVRQVRLKWRAFFFRASFLIYI